MSLDFTNLIQQRRERFSVLEKEITDPNLFKMRRKLAEFYRNMLVLKNC